MHITVHAQFTPQFGYQHFVELVTIKFPCLHKFPDQFLTLGLFPDVSLAIAKFPDISRFPD